MKKIVAIRYFNLLKLLSLNVLQEHKTNLTSEHLLDKGKSRSWK